MTLDRLLITVVCAVPAWSAVVYNNFGPGHAYSSTAYTIYAGASVAAQFVPSETGLLDTVRMALWRSDPAVELSVSLRMPGADPNGAAIETWTLAPVEVSPAPAIALFRSSLHPVLTAGSAYWLRAESASPFPFQSYAWAQNVTGDAGPSAVSLDGGLTWAAAGPNPAFDVNTETAAIPEPASSCLLAFGLVLVIVRAPRPR
jgi:hypothetical protein